MLSAINYAKKTCDMMIRTYQAEKLPPEGYFHYHQGVFLSGVLNTYKKCNDEKYFNYIKDWVDSLIKEDGSIPTLRDYMLDDIQPAILLFDIMKKTEDKRYKIALETLMDVIRRWPCNPVGGYWHKMHHINEMWLDGLYMVGPLQALYAQYSGESVYLDNSINQAILMYENMQNKETKLLPHAWEYYKRIGWADPKTGLAPEVWGRALGWYVVAILDILEITPQNHEKRQKLIEIEKEILEAILKCQDKESGMWYQVVNKGDHEGNWLESSCSSLFAYAMAKAVRMGICDEKYLDASKKAFCGIIEHSVELDGDDVKIGDICVGTGVCDYEGYIQRPTSINDLHGTGAFLLMCAELIGIEK